MELTNKIISTKANTLYAMKNLITHAKIEKMYILKVKDFWKDKQSVCVEIQERFEGCRIVVRSSSSREDCLKSSNAGHYKSILDVNSASLQEIEESIDEVIASYEEDMINQIKSVYAQDVKDRYDIMTLLTDSKTSKKDSNASDILVLLAIIVVAGGIGFVIYKARKAN